VSGPADVLYHAAKRIGYYAPDAAKAAQAMRPSETFNQALAKL